MCFSASGVWNMANFLVTPLPKRLYGGNTASGFPSPPLFLSLFSTRLLSLMFPLVSRIPSSPPSRLAITVCLCFIRSERCCGAGLPPRNKAEFFHPHLFLYASLSFLCISPPAFFFSPCVFLFHLLSPPPTPPPS
ncbi:hypothetical protein GOODEAATRI_000847 [Goodea atripinnis]|uniref:Transmembrane protein n=1 Tax=Goodea atripinnis TaxID=208336 RepID=A0ABV0MNA1_9TELE